MIPCKDCITRSVCIADMQGDIFTLMKKCCLAVRYMIDKVEGGYNEPIETIYKEELYRSEVMTTDKKISHIINAIVEIRDELKMDNILDPIEHRLGDESGRTAHEPCGR